ncbi:hypothetical protein ABW19_dt0200673 [Dactylella cylindrospora]|nr:hypothetical protein ABW19_dt0200673 [Dactylella cylindrospora]
MARLASLLKRLLHALANTASAPPKAVARIIKRIYTHLRKRAPPKGDEESQTVYKPTSSISEGSTTKSGPEVEVAPKFKPRTTPPFRAEHVGSLLRPKYLIEARQKFENDEMTAEELSVIEDRAIDEIIKMQQEVGLKTFSDGEFRRHIFFDGFFEHLNGIDELENPPLSIIKLYLPDIRVMLAAGLQPVAARLCTGKISHSGYSEYLRQYNYLKEKLGEGANIKMTLASPEWIHLRHGDHAFSTDAYPTAAEFFKDLAAAYRREIEILYEAGCRNIQIDSAMFSYFCDKQTLDGMVEEGISPDRLLEDYIQLYKDCLRDKKEDMVVGMHICRGNFQSIGFAEGGYEHISKRVFSQMPVDVFYLEYDTPRAGSFDPLIHVAVDKHVVLGLISSKFAEPLEDLNEMKEKVMEAARVMAKGSGQTIEEALGRLSVSPQCGFGSHHSGNVIDEGGMRKKLGLVKELAKSIWGDS